MVEMVPATLADELERDARIVVFGEDVADCSREDNLAGGEGQGRRLQGHLGLAAAIRLGARVQFAAGRSQHRRPRHRHGRSRA